MKSGDAVKVKHNGKVMAGIVVTIIDNDPWHAKSYAIDIGGKTVQKKEWEIVK